MTATATRPIKRARPPEPKVIVQPKDPRSEDVLRRDFKANFRYIKAFEIEQLRRGWDVANHGRPVAQNEAAIQRYLRKLAQGSVGPPEIVRQTPDGYDPLDGVQRFTSLIRKEIAVCSVYLVDPCPDALALKIRIFANLLFAGHPEPEKWTKKQAVEILIVEQGMSVDEVAEIGGWSRSDILKAHQIATWGFALRCAGGPDDLTDGVLYELSRHGQLEDLSDSGASEPIVEFCKDLKRGKFTNGQAAPFIEEFFGGVNRAKRKRLYDQFNKRLDCFREDPEVQARLQGRKSTELKPEINLRGKMKSVLTAARKIAAEGIKIRYMEEYFHLWNQVERELKTIGKSK